MIIKTIKIYSQLFFFIAFLVSFFAVIVYPTAYVIDARWFLRVNPLPGFLVCIASAGIIPEIAIASLVVTVITAIFGRVFCGFFCPLGAIIDFSDKFIFNTVRNVQRRPAKYLQKLKYVFLFAVIVIALTGTLFPLFMDPLSLLTRITTALAYPLPAIFDNLIRPLLGTLGAGNRLHIPFFYGTLGIGFLFVLILAGSFFDRRFWCQYVCPSGAFFGLVSRFASFHRRTHSASPHKANCTGCKACVKVCPTRAIGEDHHTTSTAECILCGKCIGIRNSCSAFSFGNTADLSGKSFGPDIGRRQVITGIAAGTLMLPVLKANALTRRDNTGRLIRPPGAVPESAFGARCLACGQCMKVCPTNALQPCTLDDGFSRLSTPKLAPRIGGCEEKCCSCGHVCPTSAIRKLSYEEKRFAKIGTAVIDRHRCLAWEQKKECLVCDEVCPYNAITPRTVETTKGLFKVPVVDEDLCIGCGMCEQQCPIFDVAAIVVFKFGENRRLVGPYASDAQKKLILEKRQASDSSNNVNVGTGGFSTGSGTESIPKPPANTQPEGGNPPSSGFSN
jgi:MauM/NapG family ferredoxin protein